MTEATGYPVLDELLPRIDRIETLDAAGLDAEHIAVLVEGEPFG